MYDTVEKEIETPEKVKVETAIKFLKNNKSLGEDMNRSWIVEEWRRKYAIGIMEAHKKDMGIRANPLKNEKLE